MARRKYPKRFYKRDTRLVYLDVTAAISRDVLRAAFNKLVTTEGWSLGRRNNRWSYLNRALNAAVEYRACDVSDLRPILDILYTFAPAPDGPSSVRKTLRMLLGKPKDRPQGGYRLDEARWSGLIAAIGRRGGGRQHFAHLESLLRFLGAWDNAPRVMPSVADLREAASEIGMAASTVRAAVSTYRQARARLIERHAELASDWAPIAKRHGRSGGLETLPHECLVPVLRAAGVHKDPADMTSFEILKIVAPKLHDDLMAWKCKPRRGERHGLVTLKGEYHAERCVIRLASGLLRAGRAERLQQLTFLSLWGPTEPPFENVAPDNPVLLRVREFTKQHDVPVLHPPVRVALDALGPISLELARATDGKYTSSNVSALQRLWTLTAGLFRLPMLGANPNAWQELERQYKCELAHVRAHEATPYATRDKAKVLETISLPQLVCLGLPMLEMVRERARAMWLALRDRAVAAGHDPSIVPAVCRAYDEYAEAAEIRLITGIYIADGLRLNNYRNGVLGENYLVEFTRDADGAAIGLAAVKTEWVGGDRAVARTKRGVDPQSGARTRRAVVARRRMPPWAEAHVPLHALWQYLSEVTLPRAIEAAALPATATVEDLVRARRVPMILSPACTRGRLILPSGTTIGVERVGRALWWTARYVLGRDIPEWDDLSRTDEWYRILVGHDIRLLGSCFWGKVMGDWEYAAALTNDKVQTLRDFYTADAYARWAEAGGDTTHWDHPRAFVAEMLSIRDNRAYVPQPASYRVQMPRAARELLSSLAQPSSRKGAKKPRAIRRARPGQRPPAIDLKRPAVPGNVGAAAQLSTTTRADLRKALSAPSILPARPCERPADLQSAPKSVDASMIGSTPDERPDEVGVAETAQILGVSVETAQKVLARGDIPSRLTPAGHRHVLRRDVEIWRAKRAAQRRSLQDLIEMTPENERSGVRLPSDVSEDPTDES